MKQAIWFALAFVSLIAGSVAYLGVSYQHSLLSPENTSGKKGDEGSFLFSSIVLVISLCLFVFSFIMRRRAMKK